MLRIRLARFGRRKRPHYRVVVAESKWARDGRRIDELGHYDPMTDPSTVVLDVPRTDAWIAKGAQPSERVRKLLAIARAAPPADPAAGPAAEVAPPSAAVATASAKAKAKAPAAAKPKAAAKNSAKASATSKVKARAKSKAKATAKAKPSAAADGTA